MEDICYSCLSSGRKLQNLNDTIYRNIYLEILSEISVYTTENSRICWECIAVLRKWISFKNLTQRTYIQLVQCAHQDVPKLAVSMTPRLQASTTAILSYNPDFLLDHDDSFIRNDKSQSNNYKSDKNLVKSEISDELCDDDNLLIKSQSSVNIIQEIKVDEEEHQEPAIFVNDLLVEVPQDDSREMQARKSKTKTKAKKGAKKRHTQTTNDQDDIKSEAIDAKMPKPRLSQEERKERKRSAERKRRQKLRSDPVLREAYLKKERERYVKKKAAGVVVPRSSMTSQKLRSLRKKNLVSALASYRKKTAMLRKNTRPNVAYDVEYAETPRMEPNKKAFGLSQVAPNDNTPMKPLTRRSLRLESSKSNRRRCDNLQIEVASSSIFFATSSLQQTPPMTGSPQLAPNISGIDSISRPDSPASNFSIVTLKFLT